MKEPTPKQDMSTQELILNHAQDKYSLINYVMRWSKEIAKKSDVPLTTQDLLDTAIRDILTEKVSFKDIKKLGPYREVRKRSRDDHGKDKNSKKKK